MNIKYIGLEISKLNNYAIYYRKNNTIYYNLNCIVGAKLIILK